MRFTILLAVAFFFAGTPAHAQIVVQDSCHFKLTDYTSTAINDTIYFLPDGVDYSTILVDTANYKGYAIQWDEYNPGVGYQPIDTTIAISFSPSTEGKGYRLTLTSTTDTVTGRYWFIKNDFSTEILTKDLDGNLSSGAYTSDCKSYGPIRVSYKQVDVFYYDPQSGETLYIQPEYTATWEKELNVTQGKMRYLSKSNNTYRYQLEEAYWKDMYYTFVLTDACGNERRDSVYIRSINPHASFNLKHVVLTDSIYYPDESEEYYYFYSEKVNKDVSAPALYMFINKSENAHEYLWSFGDSIKQRTTKDTVVYTYWLWGDYDVKLTAEHKVQWWTQTCTSDTTIPGGKDGGNEGVSIDQPTLMAPNVFSINSASYQGTWRFTDVSISDFEIAIYSRSGRRIHHFKGNVRDWNGWDGRINNSGNYVPTGVYWYIVKNYTYIRNFDPVAEAAFDPGTIWQGGSSPSNSGGTNTSTTTSNSTSNSEKKRDSPNSEYRGFIHVYND